MVTPFTKEACEIAPNEVSPLHPPRIRLRLGHDFIVYPAGWVHAAEVPFWVYIPNNDGGTLTVEFSADTWGNIRLSKGGKVLTSATGVRRLRWDVPRGELGRIEVRTYPPANPVRAQLRQEWQATDGQGKPLIPWNFWYYPFGFETPEEVARRQFSSRAVQVSALYKCDRVSDPSGQSTPALTWEHEHGHLDEDPGNWEGHCDGAASASVYFEQPVAGSLAGVEGGFTADELEFLAAEWSGVNMNVVKTHFTRRSAPLQSLFPSLAPDPRMGQVTFLLRPDDWGTTQLHDIASLRYKAAFPEHYETVKDSVHHNATVLLAGDEGRARCVDAFGEAGAQMLAFISENLGAGGHPIITNVGGIGAHDPRRPGYLGHGMAQVWNHALFRVTTTFTERIDAVDDHCRDTPLAFDVDLVLHLNVDERPTECDPQPALVRAHGVDLTTSVLTLAGELRLDYSVFGDVLRSDGKHFIDSWAARNPGRWLPQSLMVLGPPGGTDRHYNPEIPDSVVALLQRRSRYR